MDSNADSPKLGPRTMPFMAILQHDLKTLWASRLVRIWLLATIVLTFTLTLANWTRFQDAPLVASLLFPYLVFPWFFVVVVLGVSPVSGAQGGALADGILSRAVSRCEYLLATWAARVALVLGVYLIVIIPAVVVVALAKRPISDNSLTVYGVVSALFVVGLVQTFLVSLGFLAGTLLRKPLLAVVILIFIWYPISLVLSVFSLEEFSPISLSRAVSSQLRQPWHKAEEDPNSTTNIQDAQAFSQQVDHFLSVLSGAKPRPEAAKPEFFEGQEFEDFSLLRVILGYGLPTLLVVFLATLCFYRRDL